MAPSPRPGKAAFVVRPCVWEVAEEARDSRSPERTERMAGNRNWPEQPHRHAPASARCLPTPDDRTRNRHMTNRDRTRCCPSAPERRAWNKARRPSRPAPSCASRHGDKAAWRPPRWPGRAATGQQGKAATGERGAKSFGHCRKGVPLPQVLLRCQVPCTPSVPVSGNAGTPCAPIRSRRRSCRSRDAMAGPLSPIRSCANRSSACPDGP